MMQQQRVEKRIWGRRVVALLLCCALGGWGQKTAVQSAVEPPRQGYQQLMERAAALYQAGRFDPAILLFKKAEERGASAEVVAFNVGNCRYRSGDLPRAAAAYRRAIRLSAQENSSALLNLAAVLYRMGEHGEAAATYRRLLRSEPHHPEAWLFLGEACSRTSDIVCAQQSFEKAHQYLPDDVGVIYRLAEVHLAMKEFDEAVALIRQAYRLHPEDVDFLFYIGDLYRADKQWDAAADAYREGLAIRPEESNVLYKLADVLVEGDKPFLALETLQKLLLLDPKFSDGAVFLGNISFDHGWMERAEQAYLQAAEQKNGEGVQGLRNIAYEAERKGETREAYRLIELALSYAPNDRSLRDEAAYFRELLSE